MSTTESAHGVYDMTTVFVSDIFGKTSALQELASSVTNDYLIIDPYGGEDNQFASESDAYQFFTANIGLESYTKHLQCQLINLDSVVNVVGFSVGAASLWSVSNSLFLPHVNKAFCFYGSQIRHHRTVSPLFPVSLIFPQQESHFSVDALITDLQWTKNTHIRQVKYSHGFMNRLSKNFNQQGYECEVRKMRMALNLSGNE